MHHLRLPALLLVLLALLHCVTMAPGHRYFNPSSSGERESALTDSEAWLGHVIVDNPFIGLFGTRKQRGLRTLKGHQINKRKCKTATCVTQRLADFLVRSSNTIGTVYAPTNVGSATYGKRDLPQPLQLPVSLVPAQEAPRASMM